LATSFFQDETVSEVRERANILEVVSDYVSIKKNREKPQRPLSLPFREDPVVHWSTRRSRSFTALAAGRRRRLHVPDEGGPLLIPGGGGGAGKAIRDPDRPREVSPAKKKEVAKREVLFQINQVASDYFHDRLLRHREGEAGRAYFAQRG